MGIAATSTIHLVRQFLGLGQLEWFTAISAWHVELINHKQALMGCDELSVLCIRFHKPAVFFNNNEKKKFPFVSRLSLCLQRAVAV